MDSQYSIEQEINKVALSKKLLQYGLNYKEDLHKNTKTVVQMYC